MKKQEFYNRTAFALCATVIGMLNLMVGIHVGVMFLTVVGGVFLTLAWVFAGHLVWVLNKEENTIQLQQKLNDQLKKLKREKKGALWIWAVCLLSLVVLAIGWFSLTWPTFILIDIVTANYSFPSEVQPAIDLIKTIFAWFLIIMALGLLLWAYVASQRREDVTYPYG